MQDGHETIVDSDEGSSQGERSVSNVPEQSWRRDRLRELENLYKQVNDLEIELRGRRHRRDWEGSSDDLDFNVKKLSRGGGS